MKQPYQFIQVEKYRRLKDIEIGSFDSVIRGFNNKKQLSTNITPISRSLGRQHSSHRPLPCNYKSQSLDKKLTLFFQKRGRPKPQVLVPRTIIIKSKPQITLPEIKTQFEQRINNPYNITKNSYSIDLKKHFKTVPTEECQPTIEQKAVKRFTKKQQRKSRINSSKKLSRKQAMMTRHGWIDETKQQWIMNISKIFS